MVTEEQYECLNCLFIGPLNQQGGCSSCGSQAVYSHERIGVIEHAAEERRRKPVSFPLDLDAPYVIGAAGFWLERFHRSGEVDTEDAA
jgi:hypothetical protein